MATRSFIGVVVNPQDKGKFIEPNIVLLGKGISSDFDEPEFHRTTIENTTEVIRIYHHWDGYPEGVGETLLSEFNTYEKALNLMSFGDASSINGVDATFYNSWRAGEDWDYTKPKQFESVQEFESKSNEEYIYLFKDGKWFVKDYYADDPEWKELAKVLDHEA